MTNRLLRIALLAVFAGLAVNSVSAQKVNKFPDAIERSGAAAKIVASLALVSELGLPRELVDKAAAVGVFPKVTKDTAMFSVLTQGYGVICSRQDGKWTMPAYYQFTGGGYGNPFTLRNYEQSSVIFFFMTKDAVAAFEKGGVRLKGDKNALAGPLGTISDEQRKDLAEANILAYAFVSGDLKGTTFKKSFWKSFLLNPDNNINGPLYGMKGREVLAGKKTDAATLPAGITAYQEALAKYFPQP